MGKTLGCLSADGKEPDKERLEIQWGERPEWRAPGSPKTRGKQSSRTGVWQAKWILFISKRETNLKPHVAK